MDKHYVKYGGVRFINNATPEEINRFVNELDEKDRHSLYNVVTILEKEGFISFIEGDTSTIDRDMEEFLIPNDDPDPYF